MLSIEHIIYNFINSFYTEKERLMIKSDLLTAFNVEDFTLDFNSLEWKNIEDKYKSLLHYTNLNDFHLEVADRASYFIHKIFEKYVNDDVFVIHSSFEHPNVLKELEKVKNKKCLFFNQLISFNLDDIMAEYKASGCNKIFVYVPGTSVCTGQIIPQNFFIKIKNTCERLNINCILVCDDVHGMFITPRDYSIFDFVLYTCHSYIPGFDMGMLWSKSTDTLGFTNIKRAQLYYNKLVLFLNSFNKIRLFPILLCEYFAEELEYTEHLDLYTNTTPHIFALKTKGLLFNQEYYDKCNNFKVELGETRAYINFIRMRIQEFILEDPDFIIKALQTTKKVIKSILLKSQIQQNEIVFDGQKNIQQTLTENILFK